MGIRITNSGMHTTVQDSGRNGFQRYGFSASGAMDLTSLRLANILVGNERDEAGLEMMVTGSSFLFTQSNTIALTGAECRPKINGKPVKMYQTLKIDAGDELTTGSLKGGTLAYIAFAGGLDIPEVMNSRSTSTRYSLGGFHGRTLETGDSIAFRKPDPSLNKRTRDFLPDWVNQDTEDNIHLRVIPASKIELFSEKAAAGFFEKEYTVSSRSDRMGYRLDGPKIETISQEAVISEATVLGDVQVPPNGQPIVLLADRQTTGGYPVIGTVCTVDIPRLVQCYPGKSIQFEPITLKKAQHLLKKQERFLKRVETNFKKQKETTENTSAATDGKDNQEDGDWSADRVSELIETVDASSLNYFSYEDEQIKIRLVKQNPQLKEVGRNVSERKTRPEPTLVPLETLTISSPLVGLFYTSPENKETPFVKEGDRVTAGQTVGRVEALNLSYDVTADKSGIVRSFQVNDGQMVEYGQPIMELESEE
ncbi:5-oxoprolinase/urea amidolyase family protein [Alkalibacterium putridalgicola]|uniref:5-oxoprolinase/urea amidolyase family protein n=1 Tax=Alkalibacterium putridalgicola TaxID=426703 RepID=UPI0034CE5F44